MFLWQCKTFIPTLHSQKQKQKKKKELKLTFVAIGNRSQAKKEEGEKIHSVHLKEERGEDKRVGVRKENREENEEEEEGRERGVQFMHQQQISSGGDSTVATSRSGISDGTLGGRRGFHIAVVCPINLH